MSMIKIITNHGSSDHVSLDTVDEFVREIVLSDGDLKLIDYSDFKSKIANKFYNTSRKLSINNLFVPGNKHQRKKHDIYIAILMGANFRACLPAFYTNALKNIYLFDAWFDTHQMIIDFINDFKVENVFISSSEAVRHLKRYKTNSKFHWIPEGINLNDYKYLNYENKNIDVVQIGRKYDKYHDVIVEQLAKLNRTYLFEKIKGELIFPTRDSFINGLAASKVSICFPSSITHPDRAKGIETMTIRFLQSIASKCLVVGKAPEEMIELFGYNPVIEIDYSNPAGQLVEILNNYGSYMPLIEKNYSNIINHKWSNRWDDMKKVILA